MFRPSSGSREPWYDNRVPSAEPGRLVRRDGSGIGYPSPRTQAQNLVPVTSIEDRNTSGSESVADAPSTPRVVSKARNTQITTIVVTPRERERRVSEHCSDVEQQLYSTFPEREWEKMRASRWAAGDTSSAKSASAPSANVEGLTSSNMKNNSYRNNNGIPNRPRRSRESLPAADDPSRSGNVNIGASPSHGQSEANQLNRNPNRKKSHQGPNQLGIGNGESTPPSTSNSRGPERSFAIGCVIA